MITSRLLKRLSLIGTVAALAGAAYAAEEPAQTMDGTHDNAALIASAMRAAPVSVAKNASVVTMDAAGRMHTLRKGSNGFTCMPDNPATPGPDSMCMDANAMEWVNAWVAHHAPIAGKVGFMYMLEGGTDASNTDPYATKPEAGNHWVHTGPHVMVVGAAADFYDAYPKDPEPDTTQPYVMWAGTPYQHLMAPVH